MKKFGSSLICFMLAGCFRGAQPTALQSQWQTHEADVGSEYVLPTANGEDSNEIKIQWLDMPQKEKLETLLRVHRLWESTVLRFADLYQERGEAYWQNGRPPTTSELKEELNSASDWYLMGTIEHGKYAGSSLYSVTSHCLSLDDLCVDADHKILLSNTGAFLLLDKYSKPTLAALETLGVSVSPLKINNMDTPESLAISGSSIQLNTIARTYRISGVDLQDTRSLLHALSSDSHTIEVRTYNDGCFLATNRDGSSTFYDFDFPRNANGALNIVWNDGRSNVYDYTGSFYFDTCNVPKPCKPRFEFDPSSQYEVIGKTSWGEPVYRETIPTQTLNESEMLKLTTQTAEAFTAYTHSLPYADIIMESEQKAAEARTHPPSFKDFYDGFAVIYIKDPLGRLTAFLRREYERRALGCEPVNDYREYYRTIHY